MGNMKYSIGDKDLLLKDLSTRLPYGVKVNVTYSNENASSFRQRVCTEGVNVLNTDIIGLYQCNEIDIRSYLFPMSSMSEEQYNEFFAFFHDAEMKEIETSGDYLKAAYLGENAKRDWLNKNNFDYQYLIPKGLAIDATGKNIY